MENLSNKPSALNESYDEMMARYNKEQQEKEQELFDQFNVSFFTEDQLYIHSIHFSDEEDIFSSSYVTLDVAFEEQDKPNATIFFEEPFWFWDMLATIDEDLHDSLEDEWEGKEMTIRFEKPIVVDSFVFNMYKRPVKAGKLNKKNYAIKNSCVGIEDYCIIQNLY